MEKTKENNSYVLYTSEGKYVGTLDDLEARYSHYEELDKHSLVKLCILKDRTKDLMIKRYENAWAVIDLIAEAVDMNDNGYSLYCPDIDNSSPIVKAIDDLTSRAGDKAQLEKRVQELERENEVLVNLLKKG